MYPANRDLTPHIGDPEIAQMRLVDCLIHLLVLLDAPKEIVFSFLGRHVLVVRIAGGDFECDICCDDGWIVTNRLKKDHHDALFLCDPRFNLCPEVVRLGRYSARGKAQRVPEVSSEVPSGARTVCGI